MKSIIIYFSGTGNTHFIAQKIQELRENKEEISLLPFEQYDSNVMKDIDRVYIGFPVYGLSIPHLLESTFFEKLAGKQVYIFATMAYSAGVSLNRAVKLAQNKDAIIIGARTVIMPGSDGMGFMKEDSPQIANMCDRDFDAIPEMAVIEEDFRAIDEGDLSFRDKSFGEISSIKKGLLSASSQIMKPMEKWLSSKLNADENCTGCSLCEKICPTHNIRVTGKEVAFGDQCTLCVRCVHHCPSQAINIGKMTKGKFKYPGPGEKKFRPIKLV